MNFKNRKKIIFLMFLVILLLGLSVASAANVTKTSDKVSKKSVDTSKVVKNFVVDKKVVKNTTKESIKAAMSKTKTKVTISNVKKQYEVKDQLQVEVKLTDNKNNALKNQYVTVKVNKDSYKVKTDKKGVATTKNITLSKVGKYTITANFAGTNNYTVSRVTQTIQSTKITTKIESNSAFLEYGPYDSGFINFTLRNKEGKRLNISPILNVTINGKSKNVQMKKGILSLKKTGIGYLENGEKSYSKLNGVSLIYKKNNTITIKFDGNSKYKTSTLKTKLLHERSHVQIDIELDKKYNYGTILKISPILKDLNGQVVESNYKINVTINNKKYLANSTYYFDEYENQEYLHHYPIYFVPTKPGKYVISLNFDGDDWFSPAVHKNITINVVRGKSTLSLKLKSRNNLNEAMYIKSSLIYKNGDKPTGEVINFTINKKTYQNKTINGLATLKYTPKKVGNYTIKVELNAKDLKNVTNKKTIQTFVVGKNLVKKLSKVNITYSKNIIKNHLQKINITMIYKPNQYLNIWKNINKKVSLNITTNGKSKIYSTDNKGQLVLKFNGTKIVKNNISINYFGDKTIKKSSKNISFNVLKSSKFDIDVKYNYYNYYENWGEFDWDSWWEYSNYNSTNQLNKYYYGGLTNLTVKFNSYDEDILLNSGNVDVYIGNYLIGSSKVKNSEALVTQLNISQLVVKYALDQNTSNNQELDDDEEDDEEYDDDEEETWEPSKSYWYSIFEKIPEIKIIYNNEDVFNFTITHKVQVSQEKNELNKKTFETKYIS